MKRKWFLLVSSLAILAIVAGILGACQSAPAPTTAPAPAPTTAPTSAAPKPTASPPATVQPVTLKFATWNPPTGAFGETHVWFLGEIEKRSEGKIKFERYYSESLAPAKQLLETINSGAADIASTYWTYFPQVIPLSTIGGLGMYKAKTLWQGHSAYSELYQVNKPMQDELAKSNAMYLTNQGNGGYFIFTKKPVAKIDDLKGMKLRAVADNAVVLNALGATTVGIAVTEAYEAMERGTIDGVGGNAMMVATYKLQEVGKFFFKLPVGGQAWPLSIRKQTWDKLSPELQKVILDVVKDHVKVYHEIYAIKGDLEGEKAITAKGGTIVEPTKEEMAKVQAIIDEKVINKWLADMKAKGLPGQETWDTYVKLIEKYGPLDPFQKK